MTVHEILDRAESATFLDPLSKTLRDRIRATFGGRPIDEALRGSWLGHPVHPAVVTLPLGAWTSALAMDVLRDHRAARRLIGIGLIVFPAAVATGWADWSQRDASQRRAGLIHAAGNAAAAALMLTSYLQRKSAPGIRPAGLSILGLAIAGVAGALGGHIAHGREGASVDSGEEELV